MRAAAAALATVVTTVLGCGSSRAPAHARGPLAESSAEQDGARVAAFAAAEDRAIEWLAAADPRLAARMDVRAPESVLQRIGTGAVLAEDATMQVRDGALDLFSFRARAHAIDEAARALAASRDPLPDKAPADGPVERPRLERELLARVVEEERERAKAEAALGDASGDLVRAIVATWQPPQVPQEWPERDAWVSKHLLEIRDSLRRAGPPAGPLDLDVALYPLERLLAPMQFPRGAAAIAQVRMAIDEDMRAGAPPLAAAERVTRAARAHLGIAVDPAAARATMERIEVRLRDIATRALDGAAGPRSLVEARARQLLFAEHPCPAVPRTRVRSMSPPPERAAICGALRALTEEPAPAAAVVALHDDVLLAFAAVSTSPPPRTGLLSHPEDDAVDAIQRMARERPVAAIGVALAADLLYADDAYDARLRAWRQLGEAPLDVVARELSAAIDSSESMH